jgi:hypothetical protein
MFHRNMLPPSSGLKCVGSGICLVMQVSYIVSAHKTSRFHNLNDYSFSCAPTHEISVKLWTTKALVHR